MSLSSESVAAGTPHAASRPIRKRPSRSASFTQVSGRSLFGALPSMFRAFKRETQDDLVGEWPIEGLSLADIRELFAVSGDDHMYDSFPVTEKQVEPLRKATGVAIDLQRYDYFRRRRRRIAQGTVRL